MLVRSLGSGDDRIAGVNGTGGSQTALEQGQTLQINLDASRRIVAGLSVNARARGVRSEQKTLKIDAASVGTGPTPGCHTVCATVIVERCSERSEEHTSELQSLMRISYAVFCLNKKNKIYHPFLTDTSFV